jgi:hypothetical protein
MKHYNEVEELLKDICDIFNTPVEKTLNKCRKLELVRVRHYYCYIASIYYNRRFSLKTIGSVFNQDHTTVLHGRDKIMGFLSEKIQDEVTIADIEKIKVALELNNIEVFSYDDLVNENAELLGKNKRLKILNTKLNHDNICQRIKIQRLERKILEHFNNEVLVV